MGLLTQTAEPARQVLGVETIDVVADRALLQGRGRRGLQEGRIAFWHVPRPQRGSSVREGFFREGEFFRYDAGRDA